MQSIVDFLNGIIWSPVLIYLCLGAGLFYSVMTRFVQVRHFSEMWRLLLSGKSSSKGISSFQALAVSLSGRVGTGNIAGVAAAIGFGGPGAVFWMWVVAFFGAATAYAESTLAQIYKEEDNGEFRGGPAYYIEKAMGQKWYAWIFAIATIFACGFLLPGVQSNSIGNAVEAAFGPGEMIETAIGTFSFAKIFTGTLISVILAFIIFGGVKRIANFTQIVVPFMALAYIITAFVIILLNIAEVPRVFSMIVGDAFTPMAGVGAAIGWGVKRGVYSNEAGQGTGPHAAAAASVDHPAQQGLVQSFSIYIDTLLVCSATAFMIIITGAYNVHGAEGFLVQNVAADIAANGPVFTQMAIESALPGIGKPFIAVALFFFAFTTILAYYYIAETNIAYIRRTFKVSGLMFMLKVALIAVVFYGTVKTANLAWAMGDVGVGLMAWLNIVGILIIFFMSKPALKALNDYEEQQKQGVTEYTFNPVKLGIKGADYWEDKYRRKTGKEPTAEVDSKPVEQPST
ncbi:alanine:cation symporter family protein [Vibrio brasiliensis]|jgi:AGCS family alanine or glycine:cation symporter|uniref:Sodium/alanine symporter n=1 Tax=Vibrio brasiliensis LMG 20546 TaxID=945543 RepID=E8LQ31_9VIBR|nr:alanine/glycine:cation symporter family protein [Vibrio brasiliensis]EGA67305.1 sodium/alanine symporter [Vibrio brasiliensis LMG 20546]MCG9649672.1 alanine:cation symporter family protein [Vibrio brasiliensis]MCG9724065.1 alanine:cation symporter family protein [Vibrio brasiliensis]MCG9752020.1 alanine:cation symporter family protein [Vibrio brasiliensis]MCG9782291.1 alanine:cation symporter family protein [Vibrio brasiliensis]|tara:strand:- start:57 stop:1595 length:1539 start_codon:yes stop_codon:yes gene_type:complete